MKILGILLLTGALLVMLVGVGGAVANLVFPPHEMNCINADESSKKLDEAKKAYDAAKGTSSENEARYKLEATLEESKADTEWCGKALERHKTYGMIFGAVGVVGFIGVLLGSGLTLIGFRKKKTA